MKYCSAVKHLSIEISHLTYRNLFFNWTIVQAEHTLTPPQYSQHSTTEAYEH